MKNETYILKDLGPVAPKEHERTPGVSIAQLITEVPDRRFYVVTGSVKLNPNVIDHCKWIYDKQQMTLAMMTRAEMTAVDDKFFWRVWRDITPAEFSSGLPYGNATIPTEGSPWNSEKETFPILIEENSEITSWP